MYTVKDVEESLKKMRETIEEGKYGASLQYDLFTTVLTNIAANTCEDPRECAHLALTSNNYDVISFFNFAIKYMKEEKE